MRVYLLSLVLLAPLHVFASEDPVQCVEPKFREAMFGLYGGPVTYSTQVPAKFPVLTLPDEFEIVGSTSRRGHISVAFHSPSDSNSSGEALAYAMKSEGWMELPKHKHHHSRGGFVSKVSFDPEIPQAFCRNPDGTVQVSYRDASMGGTYVVAAVHDGSRGNCAEAMRQRQENHGYLGRDMPTIELPPDVQYGGSGGSSRGGDLSSTSSEFTTKMSLAETSSYFASQLLNLQWHKEGEWVGQMSVGHAWLSEDESLILQVAVSQRTDGSFVATMTQIVRNT